MRLAFLALGAALPVLVFVLARSVADVRRAWLAAGLSLCVPVLALGGAIAGPDVPLLVAATVTIAAVERAVRTGSRFSWLTAGLASAFGFCTHYRFAPVPAAAALWLVATKSGRPRLRTAGPWLALGVCLVGLVPAIVFNAAHDFAPLRYQFFERHASNAAGPVQWLWFPLEQAIAASPLLFAAFLAALAAAWRGARRGDASAGLLATFAAVPLGAYFAASPLIGADLMHEHWPAWAYVPLSVLGARMLERLAARGGWRRVFAYAAPATGGLVVVAALAGTLTMSPPFDRALRPFLGWSELAAEVRPRLVPASDGRPPIVVADSYLETAQLDFLLHGAADVYSLDHPRNRHHGRGLQLQLWGMDEAALRRLAGRDALVVLEPSDFAAAERAPWIERTASLFERLEPLATLRIAAGRKPRDVRLFAGLAIRP